MVDNSQDILKDFVKAKSKFLDLKDGDERQVKYLSAEQVTTHFQGKPVNSIRYHLIVDGKEFLWDRTSRELAKQMSSFSDGDVLLIRVVGQKNQTKYFITKVE